jgi:hypothetical protein
MSESATLASVSAKEIVQQAKALGLTWTLRIATIVTSSLRTLTIVFDGDTVAISATNVTGEKLLAGDRVYCIIVPQSGNFVIGYTGTVGITGFEATRTAAQAIANNSTTNISWDTQVFSSTNGFIALGALPLATLTIPTEAAGLYTITANVLLSASGTRNFLEVSIDSGLFIRSYFATPETFVSTSGTRAYDGGEIVRASVVQTSGAPQTMTGAIWIYRVG